MPLTHERVLELFDYDGQTGNLIWKVKTSNRIKIGDIAGRVAGNGRRYVNVDNQPVMVHRLVWFYHHGAWPQENLAPNNGDYLDTRIGNLVPQTAVETVKKGAVRSTNKSGIKGISWDNSDGVWVVHIYRDYKSTYIGRYKLIEHAERALSDAKGGILPSSEDKAAARAEKMRKIRNRRLWHKMLRENAEVHNWLSIDDFLADVGNQPEVERCLEAIDPTQPIGPGNFRWVAPKYDHKTKEGRTAYSKAHRAANIDIYRDKQLKKAFGISLADRHAKMVEQDGVCAICSRPETALRRGKLLPLAVDHNHTTGAVRGLLCTACNIGIGSLQDNPDLLRKAADYIERWQRIHESKEASHG